MASNYPTGLDTFTTGTLTGIVSGTDHGNKADAINKIEAELGINPSAGSATVDARVGLVETTYIPRSQRPVHVKDKAGFVGDGVSSDAAAFADALDDLPSTGGTLALPIGSMVPGTALNFSKNGVKIIGESTRASILRQHSSSGYLIDIATSGAQTLEDFTIEGGGIASTASTTNASSSLTSVTPTTGWANGMAVQGPGIPAATTIVSGAGTGTMVMSANATATATAVAIGGIVVGQGASGTAAALRLNGAPRVTVSRVQALNFTNNTNQFVVVLTGVEDAQFLTLEMERNGQHIKLEGTSNQNVFADNCKFQSVQWASGLAIYVVESESNLFEGYLCQGNKGMNTIAVVNSAGGTEARHNKFINGYHEENGNAQAGSHGFHLSGADGSNKVAATVIRDCELFSSAQDSPAVQIYMEQADGTLIDGNYSNLGSPNAAVGEGTGVTNTRMGLNDFAGTVSALAGNVTSVASATTTTLPTKGDLFTITGTTTITSVTASWAGRRVTLVWGAGATFDVTDGSNLKLAGSITAHDADDTLSLISDGTNWIETSRSVN